MVSGSGARVMAKAVAGGDIFGRVETATAARLRLAQPPRCPQQRKADQAAANSAFQGYARG